MKCLYLCFVLVLPLIVGTADAQTESSYEPTADDMVKARMLTAKVIGELAEKCPVKAVNDMAALKTCREALFRKDSVFRASLKSFVLWGRPPNGDVNAIDRAMRWGFNWELGPFETWNARKTAM